MLLMIGAPPLEISLLIIFLNSYLAFLGKTDNNDRNLYFEQEFEIISKLGMGSFGEVCIC